MAPGGLHHRQGNAARWAEDNYLPVKQEMDALLAACEAKVVASLDELLRD